MFARLVSILLISMVVAACNNKTDNQRGRIQKGSRNGVKGSVAALKDNTGKSCQILADDCLNLVKLKECLAIENEQVARVATLGIRLYDSKSDFQNQTPIADQKVLAQLLDKGGDLKIDYQIKRLKDFMTQMVPFTVVSQLKCEKVTLMDQNKNIREYKIQSGKLKSSNMTLVNEQNSEIILVRFQSGKLLIRSIRLLDQISLCQTTKNLMAETEVELAYGEAARGPLLISQSLAQLIVDHSDANQTIKQSLKELTGNQEKQKAIRQFNRKMVGRISINDVTFAEIEASLQKGRYKNIECSSAGSKNVN